MDETKILTCAVSLTNEASRGGSLSVSFLTKNT